jgi:plasmid stabilization system protein ParE
VTIRWTQPANDDFLGIVTWLNERNPAAATRVGRQILDSVEQLAEHPYLGKQGRSPATRELGIPRFPYLIVYSVTPGVATSEPPRIAILRVLNGAKLWPRPAT